MAECKDRHFRRTKGKNIKSICYLKSRKITFFLKQQNGAVMQNPRASPGHCGPISGQKEPELIFIQFKPELVFWFFSLPLLLKDASSYGFSFSIYTQVWEKERIKVVFFLSLPNYYSCGFLHLWLSGKSVPVSTACASCQSILLCGREQVAVIKRKSSLNTQRNKMDLQFPLPGHI